MAHSLKNSCTINKLVFFTSLLLTVLSCSVFKRKSENKPQLKKHIPVALYPRYDSTTFGKMLRKEIPHLGIPRCEDCEGDYYREDSIIISYQQNGILHFDTIKSPFHKQK